MRGGRSRVREGRLAIEVREKKKERGREGGELLIMD